MAPPAKSLPLFSEEARRPAEEAVNPPDTTLAPKTRQSPVPHSRLWLCLEFPYLPLEIYGHSFFSLTPLAVAEQTGSQGRLLACNHRAAALGLRPRMKMNAAYALAPDLQILERNPRKEQQLLERLAAWCGQFTSLVSLEPPSAVLLEVAGSLRLFRGLDTLQDRISTGLAELGYEIRWACAPTPLAALWLTRAGGQVVIRQLHELPGKLGKVPLSCLSWPESTLVTLRQMGADAVADCLRLPRDGFARRLGKQWLDALDRALGRRPDPRRPYGAPKRFSAVSELPGEVHEISLLMPVLTGLLKELAGVLLASQAGVQGLTFFFYHASGPATSLRLDLTSPSRSARRFLELLEIKLEDVTLPQPAIALSLRTEALRPLHVSTESLFRQTNIPGDSSQAPVLVERLRTRLGVEAVYGVGLVPEHRPEAAWQPVEPGLETTLWMPKPRPLWVLREPLQLTAPGGWPHYEGRLILESGPERIETGWWDGGDVSRDYYVARHPKGGRLWLFRERKAGGDWFLHGAFG